MGIPPIQINIDPAFIPIDEAFNRVKYFSTITETLKSQAPKIHDWNLQVGLVTHQIKTPSEEELKNICDGFDKWTGRHLLRDMLEAFYNVLDGVFQHCLILEHVKDGKIKASGIIDANRYKAFCENAVDQKIKELKENGLYVDKANQGKVFSGLKDIRNCLTHAQGYILETVGQQAKNGKRKIYWQVFHIFIQTEDGKKQKLEFGKNMKQGDYVCLQIKRHEKTFSIGDAILFSHEETFEIAWTIHQLAVDMKNQLMDLYKSKGVSHTPSPSSLDI